MRIERRKVLPIIWIAAAVLTVEIFIFNFSSWTSRFYGEKVSFEHIQINGGESTRAAEDKYIAGKEGLTIYIPEINRTIHNLFFDLESFPDTVVPYTIIMTDEGNYYPYMLPEGHMLSGTERTFYTNVYPAGEVKEITVKLAVSPGSAVNIEGVYANVRIPVDFRLIRFLTVLTAGFLLYGIKKYSMKAEGKQQLIITAVTVLLLMGAAWRLAHVNPICIDSPWPHHKQYQELAEALSKGHVYLDAQPSEELLNAENPYDTIYLQAGRIDYRADYAYYEGKYYVYFGIVPELLFYLPFYLLTGHHFPNYMTVFLCYCGFILGVFALYREIIKRWFPGTSFLVYLLISTMTAFGSSYLTIIIRPDLYHTPIIAASMFTAGGLWAWIKGKYEKGRRKRAYFLLGSLCMALVAGCRPQMLLFSFLAVALFWDEVMKKRELFSRQRLFDTICLCAPYVVIAAGIMYYNGLRFGSPMDFGATYSLTSNDMTKRSFHLSQTLLGLWHYFLQPPSIESDFPFLQANQIVSSSYMGKLNSEYTYGGILTCNIFTWVLFFIGKGKKALKEKGIYAFILVNIAVSVVIGIVDVTGAGILQRYMSDMSWGLWLAAVLVMLLFLEKAENTEYHGILMNALVLIFCIQAAYGFGIVFGSGDMSVNVRSSNPELYYRVQSLFMF